ncbi:unnamed protein product [Trichogramma brassicae]|uniref:Uncharacterized protein n=1 Tax=Trichogramma brassicae TaxID=86971 RepID=A0A6H5J4G0_9HYME|nr:unnamed protein product [Trichogramma brassicae]
MKAKGLREEEIRTAVKGSVCRRCSLVCVCVCVSVHEFELCSMCYGKKEKKRKRVTVYAGAMRLLAFLATYGPSASGEGRSG